MCLQGRFVANKGLMNLAARQQEMKDRITAKRLRDRQIRGHQSVGRTVNEAVEIIEPPPFQPADPVERVYRKSSVFYVINVLPRDGKRYRFGYTSRIEHALEQQRMVAPDCILIKTYRCHPMNADLALLFVRQIPGVLMKSREVADVSDSRQLIENLNSFFSNRDMTEIRRR